MRAYTIRFWTGPCTVDVLAERTGGNAGTEHVWFSVDTESRQAAEDEIAMHLYDLGLAQYARRLT